VCGFGKQNIDKILIICSFNSAVTLKIHWRGETSGKYFLFVHLSSGKYVFEEGLAAITQTVCHDVIDYVRISGSNNLTLRLMYSEIPPDPLLQTMER
jgi:hypothetical protein